MPPASNSEAQSKTSSASEAASHINLAARADAAPLIHSAMQAGVHEFHIAAPLDATPCNGLMLGLAMSCAPKPVLWIREQGLTREAGIPYLPGLLEWGCDPRHLVFFNAPDTNAALQAGLDSARTPGLGAVIIELHGQARAYSLTVSRMLSLASRASEVQVHILRPDPLPRPSAALTRWLVRPLPSRQMVGLAPDYPRFMLSLLRDRQGREGSVCCVEWNRDERRLVPVDDAPLSEGRRDSPISRPVVSVPVDRPRTAGRSDWRRLRRTG